MGKPKLIKIGLEFFEAFFFRRKLKALKKLGYNFEFEESKINLTQNLFLIKINDNDVAKHIYSLIEYY